jgi:UDP-glucose:glycoprotein glucosyltransferase
MGSHNPLSTLVHLSQNFPKYAHDLSTAWVPSISTDLQDVLESEERAVYPSGYNALWLNGARIVNSEVEPYTLIRRLREEHKIVRDLTSLGLSNKQAVAVLSHPALAAKQSTARSQSMQTITAEALGILFDADDESEDSKAIIWWNDIEKDRRYKTWSEDISDLARPRWGQLPQVRKNVWNLVFVLDLGEPQGPVHVVQLIMSFIQRGMPFRMGLVPLLDDDNGLCESGSRFPVGISSI